MTAWAAAAWLWLAGAGYEARTAAPQNRDLPSTLSALETAPQWAEPFGTGPDRKRLEEILRRPELLGARDRNRGALDALLARLQHWLMSFFQTEGAGAFAQATRMVILGVALAACVGGALWVVLRRRLGRRKPHELFAPRARADLVEPALHLARAQEALAREPREAIREALLALLSTLERHQLARPDRVKTNLELASELPARGAPAAICETVHQLVRWYDRSFYSLAPVHPPEAARFLKDVTQLHERLSRAHP